MADTKLKVVLDAEDRASKKISAVGGTLLKFGAIAGVAAIAAASVFVKKSIDAAKAQEVSVAKVNAILETLSGSLEENRKAIDDAANAAMKLGFDDEDAAEAMAKLLQVTGNTTVAQKALTVSMNLARFKGIELADAQNAITLALGGNARMLKQLGIEVPEHATKEEMLGLVYDKVRGQAEKYGNTLAGAQEKAKVAFENLQETVGDIFLPVIANLFSSISIWLNSDKTRAWLKEIGDFIRDRVLPAFESIGNFIRDVFIPALRDNIAPAWKTAMEAIKPHLPLLMDIAKYLGIIVGGAIVGGIILLGNAVSATISLFAKMLDIIIKIVEWVKTLIDKIKEIPNFVGKASPLDALGIDTSGWFRQMGGMVSQGKPYIVGEAGPELFVPNRSGSIVPNDKMGGSVTINFNNPTVRSNTDLEMIIVEVKRALNRSLALEKLRV